ncbi:MAG: phenylalanine--tRNA ligase beta subunit-related protein [Meiothermus sp.]|nr:phenylalanine--tRNA ligase beta subunit-related protein [Meiothermus sp.]
MYRVLADPAVLESFPHYRLLVLYARNLHNTPSTPYSTAELRAAEAAARARFAHQRPAEHPHIAAWREAYAAFGLKPSKFPCSAEALIARAVKGAELPAINALVDLYNAVSVGRVVPVGGEDWDRLEGDLYLRFADGSESFDTFRDGQPAIEHPQAGEVVWADRAGVTCRAWNWRQGLRTRLTEHSTNAYFILDSLEPYASAELEAAGEQLSTYLRRLSPGCQLETERLGAW